MQFPFKEFIKQFCQCIFRICSKQFAYPILNKFCQSTIVCHKDWYMSAIRLYYDPTKRLVPQRGNNQQIY